MVDQNSLVLVVERIKTALAARIAPGAALPVQLLVGRYEGLGERLANIVGQLAQIDLQATLSRLEGFNPSGQAAHVAPVIIEIRAACTRLVLSTLGASKADLLRDLLALPAPDPLSMLGRCGDENAHSDVLRWLLSPRTAPTIAPATLVALTSSLDTPDLWRAAIEDGVATGSISVRREIKLGRESGHRSALDRIDLLVSGPGFLLAIENKIWSLEHGYQTQIYSSWLDEMRSVRLRCGLFLSPTGMPASCSSFRPLSYLGLVAALLEAPLHGGVGAEERLVLAGYLKSLAASVLRFELSTVA